MAPWLKAPTKFDPWSLRMRLQVPRTAKNLRRALMNDEVSIIGRDSMWVARLTRQVKITAHIFLEEDERLVEIPSVIS